MIKPLHAMALVLAVTAYPAHSASVSYTYAGLSYIEQDLDDYDCNQDGLSVYGSYALDNHWFALGTLTDVSGNKGCGSTTLRAGAGYTTLLAPGWDIYGSLSAERTEPDYGSSDTGLVAALGVRGWALQQLETRAEIAHHTVFDDTTEFNLGTNYWFSRAAAATLDLSFSDTGEAIALGARINF